MSGKKNTTAEQPQEVAAAAVPENEALLQSEVAELRKQLDAAADKLSTVTAELETANAELEAVKSAFEQYKADAQEILAEAGKSKLVVSDRPVLEVDGELFTFKMSKFTLDGKHFTADQIIANPGAFEKEISLLIEKYKILKPFKPKEA